MKIVPINSGSDNSPERPPLETVLLEEINSLYATAIRMTGRPDLAEDLVQETARKTMQGASSMRDQRNPRAWVFKILVNLIRDHLRRQKLWHEVDLSASESDYSLAPDTGSMHDVPAAIAKLNPPLRAIVLLVHVEEFTISEAAAILKIPPGTAASRLARANRELRDFLDAYRSRFPIAGGGA